MRLTLEQELQRMSDEIVFAACERLISGMKPTEIRDWLRERYRRRFTREQIYPMLEEALRRNYVLLCPPEERALAKKLEELHCGEGGDINVVNGRGEIASRAVADVAARRAVEVILDLSRKTNVCHLGIGAGLTTLLVVKRIAQLFRARIHKPKLVLHAMSPGFAVQSPQTSPTSYFAYFEEARCNVEYWGLFAPAVVHTDEYEKVRKLPGVVESFRHASEVDVIISSLATARDRHGLLNHLIRLQDERENTRIAERLRGAGWIGDVQFRPFTKDGPLGDEAGVRAFTLFELEDLVRIARDPDKAVILVAGPCGRCHRSRSSAVLPLLRVPELRVWSHLVTDLDTARRLVAEGSRRAAPGAGRGQSTNGKPEGGSAKKS